MKNPPRFGARALLDSIVGFKCFAILAEKHTPHRRPRPHLRFRYNLYRTSKSSGEPRRSRKRWLSLAPEATRGHEEETPHCRAATGPGGLGRLDAPPQA